MSLNISRQASNKNIVAENNKSQKQQDVKNKTTTTASSRSNNKDSVQLTSQALNLNKMQKQSVAEPEVNQKRIETLKAAILNGDYKINTERLAEKLSQFEGNFSKAFS